MLGGTHQNSHFEFRSLFVHHSLRCTIAAIALLLDQQQLIILVKQACHGISLVELTIFNADLWNYPLASRPFSTSWARPGPPCMQPLEAFETWISHLLL